VEGFSSSLKICLVGQAWVAHAYNPSDSGGRDQEESSSKLAQANSLQNSILKISITKRAGRVAQGEGPQFKSQYKKKKICLVPIPGNNHSNFLAF
jgi:hypothetical protein